MEKSQYQQQLVVGLLNRLLSHEEITGEQIDEFIQKNVREGLLIDYKSGKMINDDDGADELCRDVASFANSDGGILLIGVEEVVGASGNRRFELGGCPRKGKTDVLSWATNVTHRYSALFYPALRFHPVAHGAHDLLMIGIHRNPRLVAITENGRPSYYLRNGDGKFLAPDYMVADLFLNRRGGVQLGVAVSEIKVERTAKETLDGGAGAVYDLQMMTFSIIVENHGFTHADLICGVIGPTYHHQSMGKFWDDAPVTGFLRQHFVEVPSLGLRKYPGVPASSVAPRQLQILPRKRYNEPNLKPFARTEFIVDGFTLTREYAWEARLPMYLIDKGNMPEWHQIVITNSPKLSVSISRAWGPPVYSFKELTNG